MELTELTTLARALIDADAAVEQATLALKAVTEHARCLREETLPGALQELGVERLDLDNGMAITIKQDVHGSIPAANKDEAFQWLTDHDFGGLIKVNVTSKFGKGEMPQAMELWNELDARGLVCALDQSVHPQTMKAFLKEQIAAGNNIPLDLFGARPVWTASIKSK